MPQRIRGAETAVIITRGGITENTLPDIHSFGVTFQSEVKKQGYLGQKTDLTDDIFHCVDFDFEFHTYTQDYLRFLVAIFDRQKRNTPDLVINVSAVLLYPGGDTPDVILPDCKFGPTNDNWATRTDYKNTKMTGSCDDIDIAFS